MRGYPKYKKGDIVLFKLNDECQLTGSIEIVDAYGTFFDETDVSYDIMVEKSPHYNGEPCLYKHIKETKIINKELS